MIALRIAFAAGKFHAPPWDHAPNDGEIEWPPSPWRILRSIAAGWYASGGDDFSTIRGIIDALAAPPRYVLPPWKARTARSVPSGLEQQTEELVLDPFVAVSERQATAYAIWDDVTLADHDLLLLETVCERISTLGKSGSICSIHVAAQTPAHDPDHVHVDIAARSLNAGLSIRRLGAAADMRGNGLFQCLSSSIVDPRYDGSRQVLGTVWFDYALPASKTLLLDHRPAMRPMHAHVERFAITVARSTQLPPLTSAIRVAELMRAAAMKTYTTREQEDAPPVLSGKSGRNVSARSHRHAYFLPQDIDEDGRIDHIDIVFPEAYSHEVHRAVLAVHELWSRDIDLAGNERLVIRNVGEAELTVSSTWRSLTPFVLDRYPRRNAKDDGVTAPDSPEAQLRRSLRHHGLPEPQAVTLSRDPIVRYHGSPIPLEHFRRTRKSDPVLPMYHATIQFATPQQGPIALGRYAHFGLGQFAMLHDAENAENSGSLP